jgi:hypothetical protein
VNELGTIQNPFRETVVQDAWQTSTVDVAAIHRDVFEACLAGLAAAGEGAADSLLVYGPAGSGKTHLLNRLQRHLSATAQDAPDRVLRCVFVFVRLQTNPLLIWQLVRRRFATDLLRRQEGVTQLQRLLAHQLAARRSGTPRHWVRALRVLKDADSEALQEYLVEVAEQLDLGRDLQLVLEHLAQDRYLADASAWLKGEGLPESALARLDLGQDLGVDLEEAARQTVTVVSRLAGKTLPIVFCFDQIEALQQTPDDRDALFRFGRMAADLADADPHVFIISCLQSAVLEQLQASVRQADQDRVFRRQAVLEPLTPEQVSELVASRLDSVAELRALREKQRASHLFPFDQTFVRSLSRTSPCVPRRVIAMASHRFEELRLGRAQPPRSTPAFLDDETARRHAAAVARSHPEDSARVLLHGLPLRWSLDRSAPLVRQRLPGVDLVLDGDPPVALSVRNETNMTSLAAKLRHLVQATGEPRQSARVVVLRDPRLPVTRTAKRTREYLRTLEQRGVRLVEPTPEAVAALEALRSLLSDAKSGDLANEGEPIGEGAVQAWLREQLSSDERFAPLEELVAGLRTEPSEPGLEPTIRDLIEIVLREHVIDVDQAARELQQSPAILLDLARSQPERFGLLYGPPALLFELVGTSRDEQEQA